MMQQKLCGNIVAHIRNKCHPCNCERIWGFTGKHLEQLRPNISAETRTCSPSEQRVTW